MKHIKHILLLVPILVISLMIAYGAPAYANTYLEDTDDISVTEDNSYTIINGVTEGDLTLVKSGGEQVKAHVLLVKANAKARFKPIIPGYYFSGSTKETRAAKLANWKDSDFSHLGLSNMVKEYNSAADTSSQPVIAAINGDFGTAETGNAPRGSVILEGNKELAHSAVFPDEFFFGYRDSGALNIVQRTTGAKSSFTEAMCGAAYILRNGNIFGVDNEVVSRQRTGVAIKTNGDTLLITVESGITVKQLAELMKSSGCWNGVNMDGGGSITFLTKRNGDSSAVRRTPDLSSGYADRDENMERMIPSGLLLVADDSAVANNVPASGTEVVTDKDTYIQGDEINVTAHSDIDGTWVSLLKADDPVSAAAYFWYYTYGSNDGGTWCWDNGATYDICTDGQCNRRDSVISSFDLSPGNYRVSIIKNGSNGYEELTSKTITVEENTDIPEYDSYTLSTDKEIYDVGEPIKFKATAPVDETWVGIYHINDVIPSDMSFFYYDLTRPYQNRWITINDPSNPRITEQDRHTSTTQPQHVIGEDLPAGEYKLILFEAFDGDGTYKPKETQYVTIASASTVFKITYKDGEDTITGLTPANYRYSASQAGDIALPAGVEKEGYIFKGWYTNSDFSGNPVTVLPQGSAGDKTFYAKYEKLSFTVSFDTDGGTEIEPQEVPYQENATRPVPDPEKTECIFLGWVTQKNGTKEFDFSKPITSDTTVYASWGERGYIVTFDTCGGSEVNRQSVSKENGKARQPSNPKRDGYRFAGWVTEKGGSTKYDFDQVVTGDITIYASWRPITYTITYDLDGGEAGEAADNPTTYNIETPTFVLKQPTREGYTFNGWKDSNGKLVAQIELGSFGDLSLTADWTKDSGMTTDRDSYELGQQIMVTASCDNADSWVGLFKAGDVPGKDISFYYYYVKDSNGEAFNILDGEYQKDLTETGQYKLVLFGDSTKNDNGEYCNVLATKNITITENLHPTTGTIRISGYSRNDDGKKYNGKAQAYHGMQMYEFFHGDAVEIGIDDLTNSEGAWIGVLSDDTFSSNDKKAAKANTEGNKWINVDAIEGDCVNLNYAQNGEVAGNVESLRGLNYWVVFAAGSGDIIDAVPINYRTFNMDWVDRAWTGNIPQKIEASLSWSSAVANGENQQPTLTIKRVKGHFGFDESGQEITEETLVPGKDYTVTYPEESKDVGTYTISVQFPSTDSLEYHYLSQSKDNFAFKDGFKYTLKEKADEYLITYVLNGGENSADNPGVYETGKAIKLAAPSRTGYIFGGWYTKPDFQEGTAIEEIPSDAAQDYTLYAKWTKETAANYKITYVLDGGDNDASNPSGYTGDASISLKPAKKAGYDFIGWFFDKDFTEPADTIAKGTTGDLTLYAKFTKKAASRFYITTEVTGGSISDGAYVNAGEAFTVNYEANEGYELKSITIDGEEVDITAYPTSYTFENVSADHQISVVFEKPEQVEPAVKVGTTFKYNKNTYKVTSTKSKTVAFTKAKNVKSLTVPATVKYKGKTYKVTAINAKAFTAKKISTVTVGKNVKQIKKYAFKSSKAKTVTLKTKLLTKKNVKGSLKGSKVKTVKVKVGTKSANKKYVKKYKKYFTKANAGKKVTVK